MRLIGDLSRLNAARYSQKDAIICGEDRLSFAEVESGAIAIAHSLHQREVRAGDRVALLAENCIEYFSIFFGVLKLGAVLVPMNFRCTVGELGHMLDDSEPRVLYYTSQYAEQAKELAGAAPGKFETVEVKRSMLISDGLLPDIAPPRESDAAVILYTSGTTGVPKGAMLSHRSLLNSAREIALATRVRHDNRALVAVPLFHGGGLIVLALSHLYQGAGLVIVDKARPAETIELIERHQVTTYFGVAVQYAAMLEETAGNPPPPTLRNGWYGAAPMPVEIVQQLATEWSDVDLFHLYGQTETTLISVLLPEEHGAKLGTAGRELAGVEVRIVSEAGSDVLPHEVGEVLVRADTGMLGYFRNETQTDDTIRDGWIYTGDLAIYDDQRYLTLVDRKKDMIVSAGENIYPKEVEEVLHLHPSVLEAAVVGVPDPKWGEKPVAFIVGAPGASFHPSELQSWCGARLARYKLPKDWYPVDCLPRTANGKVRKPDLKALARTLQ